MADKRLIFLYKRYLFRLLCSPFSYFLVLFFILNSSLSFFIGQRFFWGAGSTDIHSFFSAMASVMVIFIPAITAISPSFKKDYSLPFSDLTIVTVKLCAIASVCLVAVILTLPVPFCVNTFGDIDVALVSCGYLGIVMYALTGVAASIFIFTLCNNNILAFTASILFFLFINNAHLIAVSVNLPDWIALLCKEFSFAWHFDAGSKGIIDSRDLLFYLASFCILEFSSAFVMLCRRGYKNVVLKKMTFLCLVAYILVLINSCIYFFRIDTTAGKKFTVSPYSSVLLSEVTEPLKITYYLSPVLKNLYPQVRDVEDFLEAYASVSGNVFYELIDPAKNHIEKTLSEHGIRGEQIQTANDSTTSYTTVYSAVAIQYLDSTEIIPFILDVKTLEYDLTSRIQYLIRGITKNVQIVIGNGLSLEEDYSYVQPWLESQGFSVLRTYFPSQKDIGSPVFVQLPDVPLLVLGTSECTLEDADALSYFMQRGGKVFIATTPYNINVKTDWSFSVKNDFIKDNVIYMLQQYGIYFKEALTADSSCLSLSIASSYDVKDVSYSLWPVIKKQENALKGLSLFWPSAIETDASVALESGFEISSMLHTTDSAWLIDLEDDSISTDPFKIRQTASEQDVRGPFDVCVALKKDNQTKCIVFSDQYTLNSNLIAFSSGNLNDDRSFNFLSDCFLQLCGQTELLALKNKARSDTSLYKTNAFSVKTVMILVIVIPMLLIIFCSIIVYMQRYRFNKENLI